MRIDSCLHIPPYIAFITLLLMHFLPGAADAGITCYQCHGNTTYSGSHKAFLHYTTGKPMANGHYIHAIHSISDCSICHYSTTTTGTTCADVTKHVNKSYDLQTGPGNSFTHTYNSAGGSFVSNAGQGTPQWGGGGTGGATCFTCHGHSAGYEYESGKYSQGKGSWRSHATHTQYSSGGSKRGPGIDCEDCHTTSNFPYFKSGTDGNADGKYTLAETDVCDACHSPGGTYDGVDNATYGAKANWKFGIYSGGLIRSGKEKWCASCHDESPSVISGVLAPNVAGNESGAYAYGTGWGYYKTGHGLPAGQNYPSKGGAQTLTGRPVNCDSCHDYSAGHIDGVARTFDCGNGCDSTKYMNSYRLKLVNGQAPMQIPLTPLNGTVNDSSQSRLCYSCHDSGPFTNAGNLNTNLVDNGVNHHAYHLGIGNGQYPADYNYSGPKTSRFTCVTCHNVHGSTRLAMVNDGKLIGREPGLRIWYRNDNIVRWTSSTNPPVPENLPLSSSNGTLLFWNSTMNLCDQCHSSANLDGTVRLPYQNVQQAGAHRPAMKRTE